MSQRPFQGQLRWITTGQFHTLEQLIRNDDGSFTWHTVQAFGIDGEAPASVPLIRRT